MNKQPPHNGYIGVRQVMTEHEFAVSMSDVYAECIDFDILISEKSNDKEWFLTLNDCVKYILYQWFDIEVVEEIKE